eukprot:TRINITY_DN1557_c0_g1_i1.p1 TRINITY_DN1557_c0_g1~~TRINITY_DN1557_c0_g1_i1.p1  ORF type:complete len:1054 (+),score=335.74 TRINITY_DN1557_c0_g1_i1:176-3163(+)
MKRDDMMVLVNKLSPAIPKIMSSMRSLPNVGTVAAMDPHNSLGQPEEQLPKEVVAEISVQAKDIRSQLVFILEGCDTLPTISGNPSEKIIPVVNTLTELSDMDLVDRYNKKSKNAILQFIGDIEEQKGIKWMSIEALERAEHQKILDNINFLLENAEMSSNIGQEGLVKICEKLLSFSEDPVVLKEKYELMCSKGLNQEYEEINKRLTDANKEDEIEFLQEEELDEEALLAEIEKGMEYEDMDGLIDLPEDEQMEEDLNFVTFDQAKDFEQFFTQYTSELQCLNKGFKDSEGNVQPSPFRTYEKYNRTFSKMTDEMEFVEFFVAYMDYFKIWVEYIRDRIVMKNIETFYQFTFDDINLANSIEVKKAVEKKMKQLRKNLDVFKTFFESQSPIEERAIINHFYTHYPDVLVFYFPNFERDGVEDEFSLVDSMNAFFMENDNFLDFFEPRIKNEVHNMFPLTAEVVPSVVNFTKFCAEFPEIMTIPLIKARIKKALNLYTDNADKVYVSLHKEYTQAALTQLVQFTKANKKLPDDLTLTFVDRSFPVINSDIPLGTVQLRLTESRPIKFDHVTEEPSKYKWRFKCVDVETGESTEIESDVIYLNRDRGDSINCPPINVPMSNFQQPLDMSVNMIIPRFIFSDYNDFYGKTWTQERKTKLSRRNKAQPTVLNLKKTCKEKVYLYIENELGQLVPNHVGVLEFDVISRFDHETVVLPVLEIRSPSLRMYPPPILNEADVKIFKTIVSLNNMRYDYIKEKKSYNLKAQISLLEKVVGEAYFGGDDENTKVAFKYNFDVIKRNKDLAMKYLKDQTQSIRKFWEENDPLVLLKRRAKERQLQRIEEQKRKAAGISESKTTVEKAKQIEVPKPLIVESAYNVARLSICSSSCDIEMDRLMEEMKVTDLPVLQRALLESTYNQLLDASNAIDSAGENGTLSPVDYLKNIEAILEQDKDILKYYIQVNDLKNMEHFKNRITHITEELNGVREYVNELNNQMEEES